MDRATFIDLEFDTGTKGSAQLADIATSLISIDELLRDLASIAADPVGVEFRNIEIVAIEMRSPLKVRLSLFAISPVAVKAFLEICRDVIVLRERRELYLPDEMKAQITEREALRLQDHVATLQHATIPLKRVEVLEE